VTLHGPDWSTIYY